jgi:arylformamidase
MPFYPGDPGADVQTHRQISRGDVANISELRLGSHTGTHVDAPNHFEDGRETVDLLPLDVLVGQARVIDLTEVESSISRDHLEGADIEGVTRLLIRTTNSGLWSLPDFNEDYVSLSTGAATYLVELGVRLIGVDYLSVERYKSVNFAVHHTLLGAGVVVLEGVYLGAISAGEYELVCLPLKIRGGDGAPARAILIER